MGFSLISYVCMSETRHHVHTALDAVQPVVVPGSSPFVIGRPPSVHPTEVHAAPARGSIQLMSDAVVDAPPRAHARIMYLGPVSPHWEITADWGEEKLLESFRARALARLVLITESDPQFRRNRERINRDAERELISLEWDLGYPEYDEA